MDNSTQSLSYNIFNPKQKGSIKLKIFITSILFALCSLSFAAAPTITSFSPSSGSVGTLVTVNGTNLSAPTSFTIGGVTALVISNTGTVLTGFVMPGATTGQVSLATSAGSVLSTGNFTVTATPNATIRQGNKLVGTGALQSAAQGTSVAISADGNTAVVGGRRDNLDHGAIWVYTRNNGVWSEQTKLIGNAPGVSAYQGFSVAISADGNTIIEGSYMDGPGIGGAFVFTRSAGNWNQQGGKLIGTGYSNSPNQGYSVALSADGNTALVGGYGDNNGIGATWVFTRSGGIWSQDGSKLVGTGGVGPGSQGSSVALSADGQTALIGASYDNTGDGGAWVFIKTSGVWVQQGSILIGTDVAQSINQGESVALSADGNTAIVGGGDYDNSTGAAWVYKRVGGVWTQQGNKLVGTGIIGNFFFASLKTTSVSLSADGNKAFVGVLSDNDNNGAVLLYTRSAGVWSQYGTKITVSGGSGRSQFGISVAVSADGKTAIAGGDNDNFQTGAAWVFRCISSNSLLSNLLLSTGNLSPVFSPLTNAYTASVSYATNSIKIIPTSADGTASIKVNGATVNSGSTSLAIPLSVGANTISTVVTSEDGTANSTYTITITRATPSTISTLSDLQINSGTLSPIFNSGTLNYSATVSYATTSINITSTSTDPKAIIKISGTTVSSGSPFSVSGLAVGVNNISVLVTAEDGTTVTNYTLAITRPAPSSISTLSNLLISSGTLAPAFAPAKTSYTASVSNATTSIIVTPTASDATATIIVNGAIVLSGAASNPIGLTVGTNTITTSVIAQDGSVTTYTINVTRPPSAISTLSNLTLSSGTLSPTFATTTTSFTASVSNATNSITVTPTTSDATATIKVNGAIVSSGAASNPIGLIVGTNTITTVVTAQDGTTTSTYTITVTRAPSAVSTLSNLLLSSGTLSPSFVKTTTSYTVGVSNATTSINLTPTTSDATATIKVNGAIVLSGATSNPIGLIVGSNTTTTVVTAQDGTTTSSYTINITRAASAISTLSNLTISSGTLSPTFATTTNGYTASVSNTTTSIIVTPTTSDATATIKVNGAIVSSGSASNPIGLTVGTNIISTVVTAQDGTTTSTYQLIVTRAASAVSTLSNLSITSATLSPTFATATISYTASVSNTTYSIILTPTASDATATIKVNGSIVSSGAPSYPVSLDVGANNITIAITAQDGTTKSVYTINVTRVPSTISTLFDLTLSSGTLSPTFATATTGYTSIVSNGTNSISLKPTASDASASIKVNGASVVSGAVSDPITLNVGTNNISIVITAEDGVTTSTYTITITRLQSSISSLSNLSISSGSLTPTFDASTNAYTTNVSNATTSITVTPISSDPTAIIEVNGVNVTSGASSDPVSLIVGTNTITTIVTAQDGVTTSTYTITVTRAGSTVSTLNNLTISSGTLSPSFTGTNTSYTARVTNATSSITITPTVTDVNATITVNGLTVTSGSSSQTINLNVGFNTITTIVTAEDGTTTSTYTINVTRVGSIATLSKLKISSGTLSPVFRSTTTGYTASVINATTSITITPTVTDAKATVTVNGVPVLSGTPSQLINLNVGDNNITTVVTAEDGTTIVTYSINVKRDASAISTLSDLIISDGTLSPTFQSTTNSYTCSVSNSTSLITVIPTTSEATATIKVNGVTVPNGTASGPIALALGIGTNVITTVVTAEDGTTTSTYTIYVSRDASAISTLSNLAISSGMISPAFDPAINNYTATVSNATTSITITPTATDATASILLMAPRGVSSNPINLAVGTNTFTILVTAQDGITKSTYTLTIIRAGSSVSGLSDLLFSETLSPAFESTSLNYTSKVTNVASSIIVTPTTIDPNATIQVNNDPVASGQPYTVNNLDYGTNTITILVTAPDGITTSTYTITLTIDRPPLPSITSFSPTVGGPGTTVTITGTNLTDVVAVNFGTSLAASFIVVDDHTITAMVDHGSSGNVRVHNHHAGAFLPGFIYTAPLPVTFINVRATKTNGGNVIAWKVQQQQDIYSYTIERSPNGNNFQTVGTVAAASVSSFQFTDNQTQEGTCFYRIKAASKSNLNNQYSSVIKLSERIDQETIKIYPNPIIAKDLNIAIESQQEGIYHIELLDLNGKVIYRNILNKSSGSATFKIEINTSLSAGTYTLKITDPNKTTTSKQVMMVN